MSQLSDIEIAQQCEPRHITEIAKKAHIDEKYIDEDGKLSLDKMGILGYMHGFYYTMGRQLGKFGFLRTHKSFLVNHIHIASIKQGRVFTDTGLDLPLSRSRADEVKLKLQQWSRKK